MTQRYADPVALRRMAESTCPECGEVAVRHSGDLSIARMLSPGCSLLPHGVVDRIEQYRRDRSGGAS